MYSVERTEDATKVTVLSTRDFEQPELHYKRDAEGAEFAKEIEAAAVDHALPNGATLAQVRALARNGDYLEAVPGKAIVSMPKVVIK